MLKTILTYGVLAGLIVGVPLTAFALLVDGEQIMRWGMLVGYGLMLIAFTTIFVAIKRRRDEAGGGIIRFWPAFGLGLGVTLVASIVYVIAWEVGQALSNTDFATAYADAIIAQEEAAGASGETLARLSAEIEEFRRDYADPLFRLPMTFAEIFPVGVLVSLVSAALLRNPRFLPARG